jgi:hypothetical protein
VLVLDGPVVVSGHLVDGGPARLHLGRDRERRQPAVAEPAGAAQLGGRGAAQPHVHGILQRPGPQRDAVQVEVLAVVVDVVLGPQPPDQAHRLVEQPGALASLHPEGPVLGGDRRPQPDRGQQPAAGQPVECGQLLGQHNRVAAGDHQHAGPQLELAGAAGGHGQGDERIGGRAGQALAQPQRVEAAGLQGVYEAGEALGVAREGLRAEPEPDADLH